jgi:hypothetical protein
MNPTIPGLSIKVSPNVCLMAYLTKQHLLPTSRRSCTQPKRSFIHIAIADHSERHARQWATCRASQQRPTTWTCRVPNVPRVLSRNELHAEPTNRCRVHAQRTFGQSYHHVHLFKQSAQTALTSLTKFCKHGVMFVRSCRIRGEVMQLGLVWVA